MMRIWVLDILVSGALSAIGGSGQNLSGPGTNEMRSGGMYDQRGRRDYAVRVCEVGGGELPDKFEWTDDGEQTWHGPVAVTGELKPQPLSHGVTVAFKRKNGGALGDPWDFAASHEADRLHDEFVDLEGICCDDDGNVWVVDAGTFHDKNFLKKFRPDGTFENDPAWRIYRDYGTHDWDVIAHGVDYYEGLLYLSFGELDPDEHYYIVYDPSLPEGDETVRKWGTLGSLPNQNVSGWGSHITPRATLLSTDWLGCKVLEWNLNGSWIRTFQSCLRSDGQCIKCRNHTKYDGSPYPQGQPKQAYQTTILSQGTHKIEFLAYTDGDPVGIADVLPYGAYTGQSANQVGIVSWENYVITEVDIPNENDCQAAYVWGTFSVPADKTALPWKVGVEVKANDNADKPRLVYIASLRCSKQ